VCTRTAGNWQQHNDGCSFKHEQFFQNPAGNYNRHFMSFALLLLLLLLLLLPLLLLT
jgi:hypothetical protein